MLKKSITNKRLSKINFNEIVNKISYNIRTATVSVNLRNVIEKACKRQEDTHLQEAAER